MNGPAGMWRCGRFDLADAPGRPLVMGILNVTPDSFSDGGRFVSAGKADTRSAVEAGIAMAEAGADIIDVGGESTRPGAMSLHPAMEASRVLPVVKGLVAATDIPISVDTRHSAVASQALAAGAVVLNDISGFRDPAMIAVAAESDGGVVVMHMQGDPQTMQDEPHYDDVVAEVSAWLLERAAELEAAGVARARIALDPGIGFGKTTAHNLELLRETQALAALGYPLLIGASRKRFVGEITGVTEAADRMEGSLAVALWVAMRGATVVRVHDVTATVRALDMQAAISHG